MLRAAVAGCCLLLLSGCASLPAPSSPEHAPTATATPPVVADQDVNADDGAASVWRFIPRVRLGVGYSRGDERWSGWGYGVGFGITIIP